MFTCVCVQTVCLCVSVCGRACACMHICPSPLIISALNGWIFVKFSCFIIFLKSLEKIQVSLKTDKTLHQDQPVCIYDNTSLNSL